MAKKPTSAQKKQANTANGAKNKKGPGPKAQTPIIITGGITSGEITVQFIEKPMQLDDTTFKLTGYDVARAIINAKKPYNEKTEDGDFTLRIYDE